MNGWMKHIKGHHDDDNDGDHDDGHHYKKHIICSDNDSGDNNDNGAHYDGIDDTFDFVILLLMTLMGEPWRCWWSRWCW